MIGENNYLDVAKGSEASLAYPQSDGRSWLRSEFSMLPQGVEWKHASTPHMDCMWESRGSFIVVPAMAVLHCQDSEPGAYRLDGARPRSSGSPEAIGG
jgi:hypothetical protein